MNLARLDYSVSIQGDANGSRVSVNRAKQASALHHWQQVNPSGELGRRALLEQQWAYFMAGDSARVLTVVAPLTADATENVELPEAWMLAGLSSFQLKKFDPALATVADFERRFDPLREELDHLRKRLLLAGPEERFDVAHSAAETGSRDFRGALTHELATSTVRRQRDYRETLVLEEQRFGRLDAQTVGTALATREQEAIAAAKKRITIALGAAIARRLEERIAEIDALRGDMDKLRSDATTGKRALVGPTPKKAGRR